MFDIGLAEIAVVAAVALVVIGPKDLPHLMRKLGNWAGQARRWADTVKNSIMTSDMGSATDITEQTRFTTKPPSRNV